MRAPLTSTQKQVFDFVCDYRAKRGVSPTLQEIGDHLNVHRVTVHAHVKALLEKKYLVRFSERASRSLIPFEEAHAGGASSNSPTFRTTFAQPASDKGEPTGQTVWPAPKFQTPRIRGLRGAGAAAGTDASNTSNAAAQSGGVKSSVSNAGAPDSSADPFEHSDSDLASDRDSGGSLNFGSLNSGSGPHAATPGSLLFPLAGRIAAGRPIESVYDNEVLDVTALFPEERDLYVLEVKGDSMIEEQIKSGDYVVCERRSTARNGDIVVAVLPNEFGGGGEATLKRFFLEGKRVRLQPANREMSPIFIDAPRKVEIRGVVVGVIRRY